LKSSELGFDVVLDCGDGHTLIMHFSRFQRDILAHRSTGAVLILEAEEIVLVTKAGHTTAKARQLLQNLRDVFRYLVRRLRLLVGE
jgi:hypothetical protein